MCSVGSLIIKILKEDACYVLCAQYVIVNVALLHCVISSDIVSWQRPSQKQPK